jgi:hypothetical protein
LLLTASAREELMNALPVLNATKDCWENAFILQSRVNSALTATAEEKNTLNWLMGTRYYSACTPTHDCFHPGQPETLSRVRKQITLRK